MNLLLDGSADIKGNPHGQSLYVASIHIVNEDDDDGSGAIAILIQADSLKEAERLAEQEATAMEEDEDLLTTITAEVDTISILGILQ